MQGPRNTSSNVPSLIFSCICYWTQPFNTLATRGLTIPAKLQLTQSWDSAVHKVLHIQAIQILWLEFICISKCPCDHMCSSKEVSSCVCVFKRSILGNGQQTGLKEQCLSKSFRLVAAIYFQCWFPLPFCTTLPFSVCTTQKDELYRKSSAPQSGLWVQHLKVDELYRKEFSTPEFSTSKWNYSATAAQMGISHWALWALAGLGTSTNFECCWTWNGQETKENVR